MIAAPPPRAPVVCEQLAQFNADAGESIDQQWAYGVAGLFRFSDRTIILTTATCRNLNQLRHVQPRTAVTIGQAMSLFTYLHERGHELYGSSEQTANRYANLWIATVARNLYHLSGAAFYSLIDYVRAYALGS